MEILKPIKYWKTMLLLLSISILSISAFAQSSTITGRVLDEKGDPIPGATVKLKSHEGATSTDVKGKFSISVPENENTIVISFVGYNKQEVHVTAKSTNIRIALTVNNNNLNEVVVVGYGTQR